MTHTHRRYFATDGSNTGSLLEISSGSSNYTQNLHQILIAQRLKPVLTYARGHRVLLTKILLDGILFQYQSLGAMHRSFH